MNSGSFSQGLGEWIGSAEVYDGDGRFAGMGRDTRTVTADDGAGRVTVDVSFEGPFSLSGTYTIADHGTHRTYEGPLNIGRAEVLGDGLVATHNYWPDLGLSQRFFLMVLPGGNHQMSLALLSRGDRLQWTVVGEYQRQGDAVAPAEPIDPAAASRPPAAAVGPIDPAAASRPPAAAVGPINPAAARDDPTAGRGRLLLLQPGRWSGRLHLLDSDGEPAGTVDCSETLVPAGPEVPSTGTQAPQLHQSGLDESVRDDATGSQGSEATEMHPSELERRGGDDGARGPDGEAMEVRCTGLGFGADVSFTLESDGWTAWTGAGDMAGSAALSGGRGLSGQFHHDRAGCRVWRREVASADGVTKAVLHIWYRGEQRLGTVYGTMNFNPP